MRCGHDREILIRRLGDPLQVETFDGDDTVFFILAGGADGELTVTDARGLPQSSRGPHRAIHDPDGILAGVTFTGSQPDEDDQVEQLRRQVQWFWHDMAHFTAALGRAQLWWAGGQLDELRRYCVNLARLRADFSGHLDGFDKLDLAVPTAELAPLASTYVPLDRAAMLIGCPHHGRLLPRGGAGTGGRARHPLPHRARDRDARPPRCAGAVSVDEGLFEQLDYLYMPSRDVAADLRYYLEVLGARPVFAIDGMGARVAMVELGAPPPHVLLADHLAGDAPVLVYRVADLGAAMRGAARAWLEERHPAGDPAGPDLLVRRSRRSSAGDLPAHPPAGHRVLYRSARFLIPRV